MPAPVPERVRGTIVGLDGPMLTVRSRDDRLLQITLAEPIAVAAVVPAKLTDAKPGSFIGAAATGPKDKLRALEVLIFPEAMRGSGEGHFPWDLQPESTMTNATIESEVASADGRTLFVGVGSNSNIAENGMEAETDRAAILAVDVATGRTRVFASGLRNPVGMAWQPETGALWTVVNERDELGNDLVPDYLTSVREGEFFGWPYSYFGANLDPRIAPQRPDLVARARAPDYALGSHTASLGLAFYAADGFPARYRGGAFIGQHGSWNREPRSGYQVVFVPFAAGKPSGVMEPVLTGFLDDDGQARGRPVGVVVDKAGALLVADDVGDIVWRLKALPPEAAP